MCHKAMETQLSDTRGSIAFPEKVEFLVRIFVLAIGLMLLSRNIDSWFVGLREDNNAEFSVFARNHLYYGLGQTKLFNTWDNSLTLPAEPRRYLNRPPLISLWIAIPMFVFGDHEWVCRMMPIAATLGSVWILMVVISRLHSPILGLLTGLFYVMLPAIAYFGRIINYDPPVQFFSLLALHGYLQWTGLYGDGYNRKAGALCYAFATVLGIGTGWTAAIMAWLIWLWHVCRVLRDRSLLRFLPLLTAIPIVSLAAVLVHIMWGSHWKFAWLGSLLLSRIVSPPVELVSWTKWFSLNWGYLISNVSPFGIGAGIIYPGVVIAILRYTASDSAFRQVVRSTASAVPILLIGLQGLIWVFVFKRQSAIHEFWQYVACPFFAVAMAGVIFSVFILLSEYSFGFAAFAAFLLILAPIPLSARIVDSFYGLRYPLAEDTVAVFKKVAQLVEPRIPVMTSEEYAFPPGSDELFPEVAYYGNRPLIRTTDINEIEANSRGCAAYIMRAANNPFMYKLAQKLGEKYKLAGVERNYMIFLLNSPPQSNEKMLPK